MCEVQGMKYENEHIISIELLNRYFASEANEAEIQQVEQWRISNSDNQKEFEVWKKLWKAGTDSANQAVIDIDAEWQRLEKTIGLSKAKVISLTRILQLAAVLIVSFSSTWYLYNQSQTQILNTDLAQVQTIDLPDGSKVTLNSESKIIYSKNFGVENRAITLRGEAYFEVAKNATMPFIIDAQGASIKVVGTQFNINAYKNKGLVKVTVIEGTVQLFETNQPTKNAVLNAGETGVYLKQKNTIIKHSKANLNDVSWKTQKIEFINTPLIEVLEVLHNNYYIDFIVDDAVKGCTITVSFDQKDLASILKVLKSTLNLNVSRQGKKIIITGDGC